MSKYFEGVKDLNMNGVIITVKYENIIRFVNEGFEPLYCAKYKKVSRYFWVADL